MLKRARQVRTPTLVLQAGDDRSVVPAAGQCYLALGSRQR